MKGLAKVVMAAALLGSGSFAMAQMSAKPPAHPYTKRHLYDEQVDPNQLVTDALKQAKAEHKRVILDFGGDWCGDCQVLDIYSHEAPNDDLINKHFIVVHIFVPSDYSNMARWRRSTGYRLIAEFLRWQCSTANGKVLYSQKTGEFNDMRHMDAASLTEFLNHWKG